MTQTAEAVPLVPVDVAPSVGAWFTGRPGAAPEELPQVGRRGNLSHRRPHEPHRLAADRRALAERIDIEVDALHHMQQVHGAAVGRVTSDTPRGAELRGVDALVTTVPGRALVVQVADCIPILLAAPRRGVAAVHAGRRGLAAGVIEATLEEFAADDVSPQQLSAVLGPAIGGCCYEVPAELRDEVADRYPQAAAETTWGTPSLDLPAAARTVLSTAGVEVMQSSFGCTRCDEDGRWFSHRADPQAGRQVGIIVLRAADDAGGA